MSDFSDSPIGTAVSSPVNLLLPPHVLSPLAQHSVRPASIGDLLSSPQGLDDRTRSANFSEVKQAASLTQEQESMLHEIWQVAQIGGANVGKDLKQLVPLLAQEPQLLEELYQVATSNTLWGIDKVTIDSGVFEERRKEFLVELIRGAAQPSFFAQGESATCTACKALSSTSARNILNLALGLALDSTATTAAGDTLRLGFDESDFYGRLVPYASKLAGEGPPPRDLDSITSRMPSFGMALVYASLMEMQGRPVTAETGQWCDEYTRMARSVTGYDMQCAGPEAQITLAGKNFTAVGYLDHKLDEIRRDTASRDVLKQGADLGHQRGVLVDLNWVDIHPDKEGKIRHGRHYLLATHLVRGEDGYDYYRLEDPMGSRIDIKNDAGSLERFYAPGTALGKNGKDEISWLVGEQQGIVYVRKDIFEKNLQTVIVQTDQRFSADVRSDVTLLGLEADSGSQTEPINFIEPRPRTFNDPHEDYRLGRVNKGRSQDAATDQETLAEMAIAQQLDRRRKQSGNEQGRDPVQIASTDNDYSGKTPAQVLAGYDELVRQYFDRASASKRGEIRFVSLAGTLTQKQPSPPSTPPPAPQHSPQDRARQLSLGQRSFDSVA